MLEQELLTELANYKMPFGKYEGRYLLDLPEDYIIWFRQKGFPKGKLGNNLGILYELYSNGFPDQLRKVLYQLRK